MWGFLTHKSCLLLCHQCHFYLESNIHKGFRGDNDRDKQVTIIFRCHQTKDRARSKTKCNVFQGKCCMGKK